MNKNLVQEVEQNYMTVTQVAELNRVTRQYVHKLIRQGKLKAVELFGVLLIQKSKAFLRRG